MDLAALALAVDAALADIDCQRWRDRRQSWRPTSEGGFDPARYTVTEVGYQPAQQFVVTHHYSGAFSSAVLRYGLVDQAADQLVGTCVLGNGMGPHILTSPFPHLQPHHEALELSRLVLLDEVPANAESWFVGAALDQAAEQGLRGVVMYSDPSVGHLGIVYQALNCWYLGPSKSRWEDHLPDGTVLPERTASKIRGLERGCYGAVRRLIRLGADEPGDLAALTADQRAAWTRRALDQVGALHVKKPGKHRYLLAVGTALQRKRTYRNVPLDRHPTYPKHPDPTRKAA